MLEDSKIIELFFARIEQAIVELSGKYGTVCNRIARNILKNDLDAEECVNDTYLAAWNTIQPQKPNPLRTIPQKKKSNKPVYLKLGMIAACFAIVITIGGILAPFHGGMVVSAYARDTDEEITAAGAVMSGGTISDSGEMKGHPLMFYLSGKDIVTVRFSCKNEQINFMDWTEKRDEYGNAQNFTVDYGEDESEYYYLTIDWVPNAVIWELTDNEDSTIAALPEEMRNDIIVMEITFENGKTTTKAITISLSDDGTFFAAFDDYRISEEDAFINRPDSEAIPHDILYSQNGDELINENKAATEEIVTENTITFSGTIVENTIDTLAYVILVEPHENELPYDAVFFELPDEEAEWGLRIGEAVTITCLDTFTEPAPHYGTLISITEEISDDEGETVQNTPSITPAAAPTIFDKLNELDYQPYTCDGLPEYSFIADDGTTYYINFSEKWVWRENAEQADLPDELIDKAAPPD